MRRKYSLTLGKALKASNSNKGQRKFYKTSYAFYPCHKIRK